MTAGTWGAVEQVRQRLKVAQRSTGSTRNAEPALDALARLEAVCQAAARVEQADNPTLAEFPGTQAGEDALNEMTDALDALREALDRVRAVREAKPEGGEA